VSERLSEALTPVHVGLGALLLAAIAVPPAFGSYYMYLVSLCLINIIVAIGLNLLTGNAGQISVCHSSFMAVGAYGTTYLVTKVGLSFWVASISPLSPWASWRCRRY
jgi:ABC-type branched-subunit amino acid transport system permease subunit